jgi:aryl-alcohol dehydrogenase-like predicted oxidoreductase
MAVQTKMKYRLLGRTGYRVSELGFGGHEYRRPLPTTLGRWGSLDLDQFQKSQARRNHLIKRAIDAGINFFDVTQPEEHKSLGLALKEANARERVYVAIMILRPFDRMRDEPIGTWQQFLFDDVQEKLALLQSKYADLLNIHMPEISFSRKRLTAALEVFDTLQREGKIRRLGASSHHIRFLSEMIRKYDCFDSVMVRYNYHLQEARDALFPLCKAYEIGIVVMKPLAWPYYGIPFTHFCPKPYDSTKLTPAQASLRWILSAPEVCTVVPGMNNERELTENMNTFVEKDWAPQLLEDSLQVARSEEARSILENLMNDSAVDLQYFAERAMRENFQ